MCLTIKRKNIKIAKEDIVCYKLLVVSDNGYITPYLKFPMPLGKTFVNNDRPWVVWASSNEGWVYGGYFHTFKKLADAKQEAARLYDYDNDEGYDNVIVAKAIIPKGSHYYYGRNSLNDESYASVKLMVTDIVKFRLNELND